MHKCLRCGKVYDKEEDVPIISGCACGSKFFVFLKEEDKAAAAKVLDRVTLEELETLETKILEKKAAASAPALVPYAPAKKPHAKPKLFGVETVKTLTPGVYEINIEALLNGAPVIVLQKGETYIIHLSTVFKAQKA
ncbi:MAG: Zn-ribbon containing protein [archaeon]